MQRSFLVLRPDPLYLCRQNKQKTDNDMKKLVIILISLMCVSVAYARKEKKVKANVTVEHLEEGGVRFHLEDKDRPNKPLDQKSAADCWEKILYESGVGVPDQNVKTQSAGDKELVCFKRNACFEGFLTAYDKHYSLILSPDIIWLLISQGIATQINENAEQLRDRLVDFEGQKTLTIEYEGEDLMKRDDYWEWIIPAFSDSIDKNMKAQFSDLMVCNFTTTGLVERISSQITMMESVKKYFKYVVMGSGCGIPDITVLGTPDDWKNIRSRLSRLDDLDLGWWREELEPVIDEFVNASEGNINKKFWLDMVDQYAPEKRTAAFCGWDGVTPAEYNGWFTVFFPFIKTDVYNGTSRIERTPKTVTHNTKVCPEIKKVDVKYIWNDPITHTEEIHYLELWAGFIGMEMDWDNYTLKPAISWMMREKSGTDLTIEKLTTEDLALLKRMGEDGAIDINWPEVFADYTHIDGSGLTLYACRFPAESMLQNYKRVDKECKSYRLISLKEITVPNDLGEWCRKFGIEEVTIKAPLSNEQKADILRQVPTATVVQL